MNKEKLQWHPAFTAALRITLADEMQYLDMMEEYPLSKKPPQIDVLIIKKLRDVAIKKKIGRIFRRHNIIEYKSPRDYLSVNDFYKVYGYTCFYQSNTDKIRTLMSNYEKNRKSKDYSAVMNFITRANWKQMEVEKKMCDALKELFAEELEEADLRGRELGRTEGERKFAALTKKLITDGRTDDLLKATHDRELCEKLYHECKID